MNRVSTNSVKYRKVVLLMVCVADGKHKRNLIAFNYSAGAAQTLRIIDMVAERMGVHGTVQLYLHKHQKAIKICKFWNSIL